MSHKTQLIILLDSSYLTMYSLLGQWTAWIAQFRTNYLIRPSLLATQVMQNEYRKWDILYMWLQAKLKVEIW